MAAYLIDQDSSEQYPVTEPSCKIGSAQGNNIILDFPDVQAGHVRIDNRGGGYFVSLAPGAEKTRKFLFLFDLPSSKINGVALDGSAKKLAHGDKLLIGSRLFEFHAS